MRISSSFDTTGAPSRKMTRAISHSAWCISSMACFSIASCSFSYPQFAHISECTMYWLMAVSSSRSRSFKLSMTFWLPFMTMLPGSAILKFSNSQILRFCHHRGAGAFFTHLSIQLSISASVCSTDSRAAYPWASFGSVT